MRDQNTKGKYQQWINSLNPRQAHGKMRVKQPTKVEWQLRRENTEVNLVENTKINMGKLVTVM